MKEAIKESDMMAYLVMMSIRLIELHRVLKPTGSLYLHCDPTASHYIKIILDSIFGIKNFRNEIVWRRATSGQKGSQYETKKLGNNHDVILVYCKNVKLVKFIPPKRQLTEQELNEKFNNIDDDGRRWKDDSAHIWSTPGMGARPNLCYEWKGFKNRHPSGWRLSKERLIEEWEKGNFEIRIKKDGTRRLIRKVYSEDYTGENMGDIWIDIDPAQGNERLGYQTQKPLKLLERIIKSSSEKGDTVLDPFCGCGTAVYAAHTLNRNWIGIDITHLAIQLIETRMNNAFGIKVNVSGIPNSFESAQELAKRDKFQFEFWAVTRIPNAIPNKKQVGDKGIDGIGYIQLGKDKSGKRNEVKMIISVKGGNNLTPSMVRDLIGTMKSENAEFGILVCLRTPTRKMKEAAVMAGMFETPLGTKYPKVQIYTITDYFNKIKPNLPSLVDFVKVPQSKTEPEGRQATL